MKNPDEELLEDWHTNPKYWKLGGLFYYNREDERLLIDKPNPNYGSTLNFAHRKSYIIIVVCISFFGFVVYMITSKN
ncbi:DUF5808 domain-containing protein [Flavobacterium sp. 25HG05S-40]|uniref:DUF5808 domain-containing protein n=1 Tax=Flavobacterium sp. 25HG05S-40 TaxID=3458682 RepID=UPI004044F5C5